MVTRRSRDGWGTAGSAPHPTSHGARAGERIGKGAKATGWLTGLPLVACALLGGACGSSSGNEEVTRTSAAPVATGAVELLSSNDVYSPSMIFIAGQLYMYFGGWMRAGQTHDTIYRMPCSNPYPCDTSAVETLLKPQSYGFKAFNDPSIVAMPGGYYIMYFTGCRGDCFSTPHNKVYFSTSSDGSTWGGPNLLLGVNTYFTPGATMGGDGHVHLLAENTHDLTIHNLDLGISGTGIVVDTPAAGIPAGSENPDLSWRGSYYQALTENSATVSYYYSTDGLSWVADPDVYSASSIGYAQILTPTAHPDSEAFIYFGANTTGDALNNAIFFGTWSP
jgi:hypothetical protein